MGELTLSQKRSLAGQKGGQAKLGKKSARTLEREEALKYYRERVAGLMEPLLNAQLTVALGSSYLYKKDGNKRFLVEDEAEISAYLNGECDPELYDYVTAKTPDKEAIKDLLNRTFGRPPESMRIETRGVFSLAALLSESDSDKTGE
jgi:hypothetical protein